MRLPISNLFSKKIRLISEALGCRTLAELAARVREANPDSAVTLEQLYKWARGRSLPRDPGAYDDLARVLGLGDEGRFVRTASLDAFEQRVRLGTTGPAAAPGAAAISGPGPGAGYRSALLDGAYATYSMAWSPGHAGQMLRGCTHVTTDPVRQRRRVEYVEHLGRRRLAFRGDLMVSRRLNTVTFDLEPGGTDLAMALAIPDRSTPAFGGLMTGQVVNSGAARPVSGRVLMVKVRDPGIDPEAGDGYHDPDPSAVARDVAEIGYAAADCAAVGARVLDFLSAPSGCLLEISQRAIEEINLPLALALSPAPSLADAS